MCIADGTRGADPRMTKEGEGKKILQLLRSFVTTAASLGIPRRNAGAKVEAKKDKARVRRRSL